MSFRPIYTTTMEVDNTGGTVRVIVGGPLGRQLVSRTYSYHRELKTAFEVWKALVDLQIELQKMRDDNE